MPGSGTPSKRVGWASTSTPAGGRSAGTPRKHARITHAPPPRALHCRVAGLLLAAGVALQVVSVLVHYGGAAELFPFYLATANLGDTTGSVLQQVLPAGPWLFAALLVAWGRPSTLQFGAGVAAGSVPLGAATVLLPLGQVWHYGAHAAGTGFWLSLGGAALAVIGAIVAWSELGYVWRRGSLGWPDTGDVAVGWAALSAAAVCVGYIPGSLVYHITATQIGDVKQTLPALFSTYNSWQVEAAGVILLLVAVVTILLAVFWQGGRAAAGALLGAAVVLGGRVAGSLARAVEGITAKELGLTSTQVQRLEVKLSPWSWVEIGAVVAILLLAAALALRPSPLDPPTERSA